MICNCSLAGTVHCRSCSNNPNADRPPVVRTNTVTTTDKILITTNGGRGGDLMLNGNNMIMRVSRKAVADVCEVPTEYVKCKTCILFDERTGFCKGWKEETHAENFCGFWSDKEDK